jgi:hypothetical protein
VRAVRGLDSTRLPATEGVPVTEALPPPLTEDSDLSQPWTLIVGQRPPPGRVPCDLPPGWTQVGCTTGEGWTFGSADPHRDDPGSLEPGA